MPLWKLFFAGVGLLDMFVCGPLLRQGWNDAHPDSGVTERYKSLDQKAPSATEQDNETCQAPTSSWLSSWYLVYVGPFFCALCIVAAIVRASEARQLALENAALDNFERKLANFYSTTRFSFRHQPHDFHNADEDLVLARNTLRSWTPVLSVLGMWFVLLPWPELLWGRYGTCGNDSSVATVWLTYCIMRMRGGVTVLQTKLVTLLWDCVLPFKLYFHPKQLYQRIRLVVRWIRYLRFAGPLIRILLKLNDQFLVFFRTRSQSWLVQMEKAKRLARRSMLFEDIQRIESLAKVQTALASVPSQMFHLAQEQAAGVGKVLAQRKKDGKIFRRKLQRLKLLISYGSDKKHPPSELYDRIVDLGQELKTTIGETVFNHLISPQTRFSVGWRIVVSCALMTELCRLYVSFRLSGTFQISLTDMIRSLLSDCGEHMNKQFRRMSSNNGTVRVLLRNLLRLPTKSSKQAALCFASQKSPLSNLLLTFGQISEYSIDIVCFIDIFVWFFTGELDPDGVVVPKPFFARCILPGTLIQVLDHPTLPDRLPTLLMCLMNAARVAGYSRVLRWGLALIPAMDMLLLDPIRVFLFRPMDDAEWLRYTESLAILPVMSGTDVRNAFQSSSNLARMKHKSFVHAKSPSSALFFAIDDSESSTNARPGMGMGLDDSEYVFGQKEDSFRRGSHLDDSTNFSYGLMAY